MAFKHGVYIQELSSAISFSVNSNLGCLVVVGTSPIHEAEQPTSIALCNNLQEAVKNQGYSEEWEKYTISEAIYSHFTLYNLKPMVTINVYDPQKHKKDVEEAKEVALNSEIELPTEYLDGTLKITSINDEDEDNVIENELIEGTDYSIEDYVITIESLSKVANNRVKIRYKAGDPTLVTRTDIIGGLEKISEIYTRFGLYPSIIIAPKWSEDSEVVAVMRSQCQNNLFKSIAIVDIPATTAYNNVAVVKNTMNINDSYVIACYPKIGLGTRIYHLSTQLASLMFQTDSNNGDTPHVSPSNKTISCDRAVDGAGNSVYYTHEQANYLNGLGIVTALNWNGWKAWGNRTSCYPSNNDVKDNMIPIRRMFNFVSNCLIINYWSKIDSAMTRRFVDSAVNSARLWISGLIASGALIDGTVDFVEEDNPVSNLADGQLKFRVTITPPSAAEVITFVQEYDANALIGLFGGES